MDLVAHPRRYRNSGARAFVIPPRTFASGFGSPVIASGVLGWTGADAEGLDAAAIERYSRHMVLPKFGAAAQARPPFPASSRPKPSPNPVALPERPPPSSLRWRS